MNILLASVYFNGTFCSYPPTQHKSRGDFLAFMVRYRQRTSVVIHDHDLSYMFVLKIIKYFYYKLFQDEKVDLRSDPSMWINLNNILNHNNIDGLY